MSFISLSATVKKRIHFNSKKPKIKFLREILKVPASITITLEESHCMMHDNIGLATKLSNSSAINRQSRFWR